MEGVVAVAGVLPGGAIHEYEDIPEGPPKEKGKAPQAPPGGVADEGHSASI